MQCGSGSGGGVNAAGGHSLYLLRYRRYRIVCKQREMLPKQLSATLGGNVEAGTFLPRRREACRIIVITKRLMLSCYTETRRIARLYSSRA